MPNEDRSIAVPSPLTHVSTAEEPATRSELSWKNRVLRLGDASTGNRWRGVPASVAIAGLITIVGLWIAPVIRTPNLAIFYMLAVVFSAMRWGRWAVTINAILSAILFDYFFVPPYRSFAIGDTWYLITLLGLLAVGWIVSILMVATREEARASQHREVRMSALYSFTKSLAAGNELDLVLEAVARHFIEIFRRLLVVLLPGAEGLTVRFSSAELAFDERENEAASWVFQNGQEAGCGTEMFSGSRIRYRPLKTGDGIVGVMGIQSTGSRDLLPIDQRDLLGVFMSQAALAITRADLATKAKHAEVLQEADKLQKALLNSVSHNLRTPLSSILGVLNTILEDGTLLDMPTQRSLLGTAQHEARRLDWLVQNLLDMTRLEGGAIRVKTELCDLNDIAAVALRQLGEDQGKRISVTTAPNLPLVPLDDVLIVQVLVNVLDNALKYSPTDAPVEVQARLAGGQLEISVLDRGRGIPEQELDRVFEKFHRVTVPGAPNGAGLGLSICKGFVEAHGGRIRAERRPQGGTELVFFLPLEAKT